MEVNNLASVEGFLYISSEKRSYYSLEEKLSLEYCKHKLKNVILNLFLKKDDSFVMVSSLGTTSPYMKRFISIINCKLNSWLHLMLFLSCLHLFPVNIQQRDPATQRDLNCTLKGRGWLSAE